MAKISRVKINKNYNKLVMAFFVLAIIIVLFTAYFAFAKTTIKITPVAEKVTAELEESIDNLGGQALDSKVIKNDYSYTELASTEGGEEEGYATGTVTIYNNYVADQPLVATTRLLSENNVLFRTQEDVIVPQGGSIEVEVKADQLGKEGDIEPTKFEIVALNSVKKDDIYAESSANMTGGIIVKTVATEKEIEKAKIAAKEDLLQKAQAEFTQEDENINVKNITANINKSEADVEVGQKTAVINIAIEGEFYYLNLDENNIYTACYNVLQEKKGTGYDVIVTHSDKMDYTTKEKNDEMFIQTDCQGTALINAKNSSMDKALLTNKTRKQVKDYMEALPQIESAEVKFSPFWVKTTPFIKNNIVFIVKNE